MNILSSVAPGSFELDCERASGGDGRGGIDACARQHDLDRGAEQGSAAARAEVAKFVPSLTLGHSEPGWVACRRGHPKVVVDRIRSAVPVDRRDEQKVAGETWPGPINVDSPPRDSRFGPLGCPSPATLRWHRRSLGHSPRRGWMRPAVRRVFRHSERGDHRTLAEEEDVAQKVGLDRAQQRKRQADEGPEAVASDD